MVVIKTLVDVMTPNITTNGITVEFPVFDNSHRSLKKVLLRVTTGGRVGIDSANQMIVKALEDITIDIRDGDRVGLVGNNGAGKTTLLRVLAGIYEPAIGTLSVHGKVAALLDVSMGLDPDATGFENIYLRGIMEGLKPAVIRNRIDEIAEFSELGDYLNMPVRTYSSGMMLRLAFSISTSVEADILIMDEWLSVGDADFSIKAANRMDDLVNKASILVIASHDLALVDRLCNRVIRLEHGRIVETTDMRTDNKDIITNSIETTV